MGKRPVALWVVMAAFRRLLHDETALCCLTLEVIVVKRKAIGVGRDGNAPTEGRERDGAPLLRALLAEAQRRGHTLTELARQLGVTYERLAQWRRSEGAIGRAQASVHKLAGEYLGIPTVLVLVLANEIGLRQFVWPTRAPMKDRIGIELERLRQDPFLGGFVPSELATAAPGIQLFVAFLFHELRGAGVEGEHGDRWFSALHRAAVGGAQAELEFDKLRQKEAGRRGIF